MSIEVAAVLSLVFLVVAIALGFAKGMNTGVVSMAFALIACIVCGLTDKQLRSGFPTNMFLILFGTMFLFNIAQKTGTMSLLSRKVIAAVGNASFLLPWAIYALTWVVSACGAGPAPSIAIVALPAISLALELGVSPFLFAIMCRDRWLLRCRIPACHSRHRCRGPYRGLRLARHSACFHSQCTYRSHHCGFNCLHHLQRL